jgi:hypothetical protein
MLPTMTREQGAEKLCEEYKCVEIVYMPQDNIDINEIVWCRYLI